MKECSKCGFQFVEDLDSTPVTQCSQCGASLKPHSESTLENGFSVIRDYFVKLWGILRRPTIFFRQIPHDEDISIPLTFALITHWISAAIGFLWYLSLGGLISEFFQSWVKSTQKWIEIDDFSESSTVFQIRDQVYQWLTGAGPIIVDPFVTLFSILVTAFLVFVGARILITPGKDQHPKEITYTSIIRVICYGMSPAIFAIFPIFGKPFSTLFIFIFTVIGIKEVFHTSTIRSIVIVLFPKLIFLGIILGGLLSVLLVMFKLVALFF